MTAPPDRSTDGLPDEDVGLTRRDLLAGAAGVLGGVVLAGIPALAAAQRSGTAQSAAIAPAATPPQGPALPPIPDDPTKLLGTPTTAVGARSRFAQAGRTPVGEVTGVSFTPLQDFTGTITPSDLHFERHHAGVPLLDPARHSLLIHGLVDRPMSFSVDDIKRFPQVTRIHFMECSGNGRASYHEPKPETTPQRIAGMVSNSEWTGTPLRVLLDEVGAKPQARWILAEGSDACLLCRSIPIEKALDDALIAWAQNGEPLRPEQGYPMRLLLPGWEGNTNVKWLRRLELGLRPWMTRWETSKYTDVLPDGSSRQFSFEMDAKSLITSPSHPGVVTKGWQSIGGLAWSGRGKIARVEVSTDSGKSWRDAHLQTPVLSKAHTRFFHQWEWDGNETILLSRATDETGYIQPTRTELLRVRSIGTDYHCNPIYGWKVMADGHVFFHGAT